MDIEDFNLSQNSEAQHLPFLLRLRQQPELASD